MKDLLEKLTTKAKLCIQRGNIPFIIGGSRDLFGAVANALIEAKPEATNAFVSINHRLDLEDMGSEHALPH